MAFVTCLQPDGKHSPLRAAAGRFFTRVCVLRPVEPPPSSGNGRRLAPAACDEAPLSADDRVSRREIQFYSSLPAVCARGGRGPLAGLRFRARGTGFLPQPLSVAQDKEMAVGGGIFRRRGDGESSSKCSLPFPPVPFPSADIGAELYRADLS